jgi:hypothetical protein
MGSQRTEYFVVDSPDRLPPSTPKTTKDTLATGRGVVRSFRAPRQVGDATSLSRDHADEILCRRVSDIWRAQCASKEGITAALQEVRRNRVVAVAS